MKQYEAKAFIDHTHGLLVKAANAPTAGLSPVEEAQLLALEDDGKAILDGDLSELRIVTSDWIGEVDGDGQRVGDQRDHKNWRINKVERIEKRPQVKTFQGQELHFDLYEAQGGDALTRSAPEGFVDGKPFGAASALAARLLEARAAGLV